MQKKKVLPGDALSLEEEFEPGSNAFAEYGNIYSAVAGTVSADAKSKQISVQAEKQICVLRRGTVVYGTIGLVKENSASVSLLQSPEKDGREVISQSRAMLPVRDVSRDYVKNLKDEFKIGDLIKAKVSKTSSLGTDLSTAERDLGVIKAFCCRCRHPLHLFGRTLRCLNCGNSETRKLSSDYLLK